MDILHSLEHMHKHLRDKDCIMEMIEQDLRIPPAARCSLEDLKPPIYVAVSDTDPST